MKKLVLLFVLSLSLVGCKFVSISVAEEGEKTRRIVVPFALIKTAVRFTDARTLEFDDLGGFDSCIDLGALAKALAEDGDRLKLEMESDGTRIHARKDGNLFRINLQEEEENITLNLPVKLMTTLASAEDGTVKSGEIMRSFRKFSGVLLEVEGPYEHVKIVLK